MNKIKKICVLACALMAACTLSAYPGHYHHHHHHCGTGFAVGAGILGAGLIASAIYNATHPAPYVAPAPVVVQQPVGVQQPVVQPIVQPVVQPPVVQNVWVEGRYVDQQNGAGQVVRVWQPGHFEQRQVP